MKQILLLLISVTGFSQTLTLTENITLGHDCGNGNHQVFTYQDVNLNGYNIDLRNATLKVLRNLNGSGSITKCGNQNNSFVCVNGAIQNNPNLNGLTCNSLSNEKFELSDKTIGLNYTVYDLMGREVKSGKVDNSFYLTFPEIGFMIVKVENYKAFKTYK